MLSPNGQVGLGHSGIGRQNKHYCMCLRNQADRKFRLCTDGIEARRIENDQTLLEQGMRDIDQRMAPLWYLDQAVSAHQRVVVNIFIAPKA